MRPSTTIGETWSSARGSSVPFPFVSVLKDQAGRSRWAFLGLI